MEWLKQILVWVIWQYFFLSQKWRFAEILEYNPNWVIPHFNGHNRRGVLVLYLYVSVKWNKYFEVVITDIRSNNVYFFSVTLTYQIATHPQTSPETAKILTAITYSQLKKASVPYNSLSYPLKTTFAPIRVTVLKIKPFQSISKITKS